MNLADSSAFRLKRDFIICLMIFPRNKCTVSTIKTAAQLCTRLQKKIAEQSISISTWNPVSEV